MIESKQQPNLESIMVQAYASWIDDLTEERFWQSWMLNFMFVEMHLPEAETKRAMEKAVQDFFTRLITRFHRKPKSAAAFQVLPRMIACPDYPVPKHRKEGLRLSTPNRGLHFNAVLFHPLAVYSRSCRLRSPLDQHVEENRLTYCSATSKIDRIDLTPISYKPDAATEYVLKALENRRIKFDDIVICPRSRTEL